MLVRNMKEQLTEMNDSWRPQATLVMVVMVLLAAAAFWIGLIATLLVGTGFGAALRNGVFGGLAVVIAMSAFSCLKRLACRRAQAQTGQENNP